MQTREVQDRSKAVLACPGPLLDNDDLPIAVVTAIRADVVGSVELTAGLTGNQLRALQEDVAPAIALAVPANSLLGKRAHRSFSLHRGRCRDLLILG